MYESSSSAWYPRSASTHTESIRIYIDRQTSFTSAASGDTSYDPHQSDDSVMKRRRFEELSRLLSPAATLVWAFIGDFVYVRFGILRPRLGEEKGFLLRHAGYQCEKRDLVAGRLWLRPATTSTHRHWSMEPQWCQGASNYWKRTINGAKPLSFRIVGMCITV